MFLDSLCLFHTSIYYGYVTNKGVLRIPQSSSITGTSPSDGLVSYSEHSLGGYPSIEMQSEYSTAQADWAMILEEHEDFSKRNPTAEISSKKKNMVSLPWKILWVILKMDIRETPRNGPNVKESDD